MTLAEATRQYQLALEYHRTSEERDPVDTDDAHNELRHAETHLKQVWWQAMTERFQL